MPDRSDFPMLYLSGEKWRITTAADGVTFLQIWLPGGELVTVTLDAYTVDKIRKLVAKTLPRNDS